MHIHIVTPVALDATNGNRHTADQYAAVFRALGHEVTLAQSGKQATLPPADTLIAIHAEKSHQDIVAFKQQYPSNRCMVVAGTDVYVDQLSAATVESIEVADVLVTLQHKATEQIPEAARGKAVTIFQSFETPSEKVARMDDGFFNIAVVGHLRAVKDPMRAAAAVRLLPETSKVRVQHVGEILEPEFESLVEAEMAENPRYTWLGGLNANASQALIGSCQLLVHSSLAEGGPRVIGEAVVAGTPILASRIDGITGTLGDDYPGYFEPKGTEELAALIQRAETDQGFYEALKTAIADRAPRFDPALERAA